jgi:hypothetical protein
MNRKTIVTVLVFTGLMILLLLFYGQNFIHKSNAKVELGDLESRSVEDVFRLYWNASFVGDGEAVARLTAAPPNDLFADCFETLPDIQQPPEDVNALSSVPAIIKTPIIVDTDSPFTDTPVEPMSNFIYYSRISLKRVKIMDRRLFHDEALLRVSVANINGDFDNPLSEEMFLLKRGIQGWRIVGNANEDILMKISGAKITHASVRPLCK